MRVCASEQRLALIWGCFKSYWLRLSLLHCMCVLGIHECACVCVSVFVCMWAFSSLAFLRARTQFSSRLSCPSSLTLKYASLCVCVWECARLGLEVSKCNFACLELFVLLSSCLCRRLCCCFSFSPISFSISFFQFFCYCFLLGGWRPRSAACFAPLASLTPSFSPCLCLCVSSCAWADLNFMVSSILPSCNIKLN